MGGFTSFVATLLGGTTGISRVLILTGLAFGVVAAVRFLRGSPRLRLVTAAAADLAVGPVRLYATGARGAFILPLALVWLGFAVGAELVSGFYSAVAGAMVAGIAHFGVRGLRAGHARRGEPEVLPAALAVLFTGCLLLLFGFLLVIRLAVAANPQATQAETLNKTAFAEAVNAVYLPAAVLLALLAVPHLWRLLPARVRGPVERARAKTGALVGRVRGWADTRWGAREAPWWLAAMLVYGVFVSAIVDSRKHLHIGGVMTAEYGKVLYLWLLATVLAGVAHRFGRSGGHVRNRWHVYYPVLFFTAVGVASLQKHDLGPLIGLFAVTIGTMLYLVWDGVSRGARRQGLRWWRVLLQFAAHIRGYVAVLLAIAAIGALFIVITPKLAYRVDAMRHPWEYSWSNPCVPASAGVTVPGLPEGATACREAVDAPQANMLSQIAHGMAVIADGGLWGRGLADTGSQYLPAGESDLVLAVVWGKLGGLVIILLGVLLALLATALSRTARALGPPVGRSGPGAGRLIALGLGILLITQFTAVFLATLALVPHSGVTAPFLSRGGQSVLGLGFGIVLALWTAYRPARNAVPPTLVLATPEPPARHRVPVPAVLVLVVCALGAAYITARPYGAYAADRPYCLRELPRANPEVCSTDRVAMRRTSVVLSVRGVPQYTRDRSTNKWEPIGAPALVLEDFAGLLQIGGDAGVVDGALREFVQGASGLSNPLGPPPAAGSDSGSVELTIDPDIQRSAATALRADADGAGPLAGGVVAIEARTGRVLAAASAPGHTGGTAGPVDPATDGSGGQRGPGVIDDRGSIDESREGECKAGRAVGNDCWHWRFVPVPAGESAESAADRRRYVDGRADVHLPSTSDNRALGHNYGLGSTFKVVVAAAYLRQPGTTVEDELPAPVGFPVPGRVLHNYGDGECPGTVNGKITLAKALAVSCNTAFLELAYELRWPAIRATAVDLGFRAAPTDAERGTAWLAGAPMGVDARVPQDATQSSLANDVLGGGEVDGTPLQMASVLAAVANGGTLVQPRLVDATTAPHGGVRVPVVPQTRQVLTAEQAGQLLAGLAGTVETGGTAQQLPARPGHQIRAKTGTHDLYGGRPPPRGEFTSQIAWLVGTVDTANGPVAFAVAVETADEGRGAARARYLADAVITSITGVRG
ncbi:cell division protein FtsW (lipid II flippase) [Actinokineospora baliensis]|uniref:penicillin-binding transpeptidase domain-containing protein n=1 Tax=Actinokineospora baliensis TaxID=547056 RepID=UPI00195E53B3|nr:penicillin-binding transpeptidase domain-containing protein [Actinokineospora baliensis]MBM7773985.1 cell division protein FtsW (lipid II flippase) [Actinokineospora baliensis]